MLHTQVQEAACVQGGVLSPWVQVPNNHILSKILTYILGPPLFRCGLNVGFGVHISSTCETKSSTEVALVDEAGLPFLMQTEARTATPAEPTSH